MDTVSAALAPAGAPRPRRAALARLAHGTAFMFGLSLVFVALGFGAGWIGELFFVYDRALSLIAGGLLVAATGSPIPDLVIGLFIIQLVFRGGLRILAEARAS